MKFSYNSKSFTLFHDDNYVEIEKCKNLDEFEEVDINGLNWLTGKISSALTIEVPDWVPGFGGDTWGINIPKIPNWNYDGAIFTKPTVLGNGQGVGDKYNGQGYNAEAVLPLDILWDKMDAIVNNRPPIQLIVDGKEIAFAVAPYQEILNQYNTNRIPRLAY